MTSKLDILGSDRRCLWYMELHYGASHKARSNYQACKECNGYDTECHLYAPFVKPDYSVVDNWIKNRLEVKRAKTLGERI